MPYYLVRRVRYKKTPHGKRRVGKYTQVYARSKEAAALKAAFHLSKRKRRK